MYNTKHRSPNHPANPSLEPSYHTYSWRNAAKNKRAGSHLTHRPNPMTRTFSRSSWRRHCVPRFRSQNFNNMEYKQSNAAKD